MPVRHHFCLLEGRQGWQKSMSPNVLRLTFADLAEVMVGDSGIEIKVIGIRPGKGARSLRLR